MSDTSLVFNAVGRDRGVGALLTRTANQVNAANARSVAGTMALRGAWVAAGAAAVALAASAMRAAGAAAAIPAAMSSAFAIVGAGKAITMGLADAWTATGKAATGGGGAAGAAAGRMAAKQHEVKQATLALKDAQREAEQAQVDLNRAREDEAERLEDLSRALRGAKLDEADAIAAVEKAEMDLALARRTGDGGQIDDATRRYEQSKQSLDEVRDRVSDLGKEQAEGAKKGVEGSDAVQAALRQQEMAQRRVEEATYQLAEAQRGLETASAGAAGGGIDPAAEALAKLSPNGRAVILMLRQLAPAWRAAANAGQNAAFAGVAGDIKRLSDLYLPSVTRWLTRMGGAFNLAFRDMARWLGSKQGIETVNSVMESSALVAEQLARAIKPIINGIAQWVVVGGSFLPGFASDARGLAETFEAWSIRMRESGQAAAWIRNGVTVLRQFWNIARDVAMSIVAIVGAGKDGGELVSTLERGAASLRKWTESAQGQAQIKAVFDGVRGSVAALAPLLGAVGSHSDEAASAVGGLASGLMWVLSTVQPILPAIAALAAGYLLLKHTGVTAVAKLGISAVQIASQFTMASALRAHTAALRQNTAAAGVNAAAQAREAAATSAGTLARIRSVATLIAQKVAMVASAVWTGIVTAAQWLWNIAMMANPIGLIILLIVGLIAIFVLLWQKCDWFRKFWVAVWAIIKTAVIVAWNWIKDNWQKVIGFLTAPIALAVRFIQQHWNSIKNAAKAALAFVLDRAEALYNGFKKLPGRIGSALAAIGRFITAPFRAAFNAVAALWNRSLGGVGFTIPGWVPAVGGHSFRFPRMPGLAKGGNVTAGGMVMVGEAGPEVLALPPAASVTPLDHPSLRQGGGGSCHHTFDVTGTDRHLKALIRELMRTAGLQPV